MLGVAESDRTVQTVRQFEQDAWSRVRATRRMKSIFVSALTPRLLLLAIFMTSWSLMLDLSRDSIKYHVQGREIAELYAAGENNWSLWIDHGWYQFIGLVYYFVGPNLFVIQLINVVLASATAVLLFKVSSLVSEDIGAASLSGYLLAFFPSVIYFTTLPLKEAPAVFAVLAILYGVLVMLTQGRRGGWKWIIPGLLIIAALRIYLFVILSVCVVACLATLKIGRVARVSQFLLALGLLGAGTYVTVAALGIDLKQYEIFHYFDIDYVNQIRHDMTSGNATLYESKQEAEFGSGPVSDAMKFGKGVFFFLFSIDPTNVTRSRQLAALPEMLFFLYCLPYMYTGVVQGMRRSHRMLIPLLLFTVLLVAVYAGSSTNMGAMYRWRLQALPFLIVLIVHGATLRKKGLLYHLVRRLSPAVRT